MSIRDRLARLERAARPVRCTVCGGGEADRPLSVVRVPGRPEPDAAAHPRS